MKQKNISRFRGVVPMGEKEEEKPKMLKEEKRKQQKEKAILQATDNVLFGGFFTFINLIGETFTHPKKAFKKLLFIISVLIIFILIIKYFMN